MNIQTIITGGFFKGKKTYITGVLGAFVALIYYLVGDINLQGLYQVLLPLLSVVFLRKGITDETVKSMEKTLQEVKNNNQESSEDSGE